MSSLCWWPSALYLCGPDLFPEHSRPRKPSRLHLVTTETSQTVPEAELRIFPSLHSLPFPVNGITICTRHPSWKHGISHDSYSYQSINRPFDSVYIDAVERLSVFCHHPTPTPSRPASYYLLVFPSLSFCSSLFHSSLPFHSPHNYKSPLKT